MLWNKQIELTVQGIKFVLHRDKLKKKKKRRFLPSNGAESYGHSLLLLIQTPDVYFYLQMERKVNVISAIKDKLPNIFLPWNWSEC